jgi:CARDB
VVLARERYPVYRRFNRAGRGGTVDETADGYRERMGRALSGLVVLVLSVAVSGAGAGGRPDLAVTTVSVTRHGDPLRVVTTIKNLGFAQASPSVAAYLLGSRRIGNRYVGRLRPDAVSRSTRTLAIPAGFRPGRYRLRVCADATGRVRETREGNNCREAASRVLVRDRTPPVFAGIVQATFCVPGPIRPDQTSRYFLKWERARDDATPPSDVVYDIYEATASGAESFVRPTYTTPPGATSFVTPPLPVDRGHFFVVRARDRAGNRDANTVERQGVSICL